MHVADAVASSAGAPKDAGEITDPNPITMKSQTTPFIFKTSTLFRTMCNLKWNLFTQIFELQDNFAAFRLQSGLSESFLGAPPFLGLTNYHISGATNKVCASNIKLAAKIER